MSEGRFWLGPDTLWGEKNIPSGISQCKLSTGNSFIRLQDSTDPQIAHCFKTAFSQHLVLDSRPALKCRTCRTFWRWHQALGWNSWYDSHSCWSPRIPLSLSADNWGSIRDRAGVLLWGQKDQVHRRRGLWGSASEWKPLQIIFSLSPLYCFFFLFFNSSLLYPAFFWCPVLHVCPSKWTDLSVLHRNVLNSLIPCQNKNRDDFNSKQNKGFYAQIEYLFKKMFSNNWLINVQKWAVKKNNI